MIVLDAEIRDVHRARDFGCVEATVVLYVKERGQPVRPIRMRTHVEARPGQIRDRLVADAIRLVDGLPRRRTPAAELPHAA